MRDVQMKYQEAEGRKEKGRILDEVVENLGCHRKHAVRMLNGAAPRLGRPFRHRDRIYPERLIRTPAPRGPKRKKLPAVGWKCLLITSIYASFLEFAYPYIATIQSFRHSGLAYRSMLHFCRSHRPNPACLGGG